MKSSRKYPHAELPLDPAEILTGLHTQHKQSWVAHTRHDAAHIILQAETRWPLWHTQIEIHGPRPTLNYDVLQNKTVTYIQEHSTTNTHNHTPFAVCIYVDLEMDFTVGVNNSWNGEIWANEVTYNFLYHFYQSKDNKIKSIILSENVTLHCTGANYTSADSKKVIRQSSSHNSQVVSILSIVAFFCRRRASHFHTHTPIFIYSIETHLLPTIYTFYCWCKKGVVRQWHTWQLSVSRKCLPSPVGGEPPSLSHTHILTVLL